MKIKFTPGLFCQVITIFRLRLLLILCFGFAVFNVQGQNSGYSFMSISKSNGLPDNSISYIFQDNKGFIWFCTGKGLVRYDGYNFKLFQKDNSLNGRSISSNRVTHIMQDRDGKFWISTSNSGINVYDPVTETFRYYMHNNNDATSIANNNVNNCFQDSKGRIWAGTLGTGLELYDSITDGFRHFRANASDPYLLPNNHITSIVEDVNGYLWLAVEANNICRLDPNRGKFKRFSTQFEGTNLGGYFKKLIFTSNDILWIATDGAGLYKFNITTGVFERFCMDFKKGSINNNNIKGLIPYNNGKLFVITDGGGLNILDLETEKFEAVTYDIDARNGITTNALYSIIRDKDNNMWIGTYKSGLLLLKENTRTFSVVTQGNQSTGLCHKSVLCILKDKEGLTWYGTDGGGLDCYNPKTGKFKCYQFDPLNPNSISSNVVKAIYEDKDGYLWIATFFGGLNKFNKKTGQFIRYQYNPAAQNSISSNNSWCIFEDNNERIWIGNFATGLDYFDKKTERFVHIRQEYGDSTTLSHTQVSSVIQDVQGNLWVGSLHGLNYMDYKSGKFRRFYHHPNDTNSLSDDFITCLYYDSKHRLWIGTDEGGLNLMVSPGKFKSYGKSDELPSLAIQSIEEDNSGNLWISTKNGLVKFNPASELFFNMDDVEDLISNEFNWNSSSKDSDGKLYFGSVDGVCIFNAADIVFSKPFPKLVFTNVKAFNQLLEAGKEYHGRILVDKSVTYGGNVTLTSKENAFTIDFAAIEFNKPYKIKYKYQLVNFDKDWVITDASQRNATYTNLPGGTYIFRLTSTNSDGLWNKEFISLSVTIIPPFYKQWWFRILLTLLLLFVAWVVYKRNLEKHRRIIREEALKREKELIEKRNEELKAEIASNTMLLLQKNESLELIRSQLQDLNTPNENEAKVRELINTVEHQMEVDVYWEQFQYNFDQVYRNLLTRLKERYPDLTRTNLKLCAYLRLNLSSKEIASLMNVTLSGIDKARNRLRKKLDIQPNDDLHEFLLKF